MEAMKIPFYETSNSRAVSSEPASSGRSPGETHLIPLEPALRNGDRDEICYRDR